MDADRKRKMDNSENEEMESFFALIKRIREIRRIMMSGADQLKEKETVKAIEPPAAEVWNPSFQPEDFMEDAQQKPPICAARLAGSSGLSKREKEERRDEDNVGDTGLDLNLSL